MIEKEISEIRRRFRHDKTNIAKVRGCYINESGEIISEFYESLGLMPQEQAEELLAILKKTLSGSIGKNLLDIEFSTHEVLESPSAMTSSFVLSTKRFAPRSKWIRRI